MRKLAALAAGAALSLVAFTASAEEAKEPGRTGLLGAVTDDLFKFGLVRLEENWELNLLAHGEYSDSDNHQVDVMARTGVRWNLGAYNYGVLGAQVQTLVDGKVGGATTAGTLQAGPYVGLERYFAGTNIMISLWVNPYYYDREKLGDTSVVTHRVLQNGGFGVAYLFQ